MDPNACLLHIDRYIDGGQVVDARILLAEYWRWRATGGYEPVEVDKTGKPGDEFARECKKRLDEATRVVTYTVNIDEPPMPHDRGGFTSLDDALAWATDEAKRIEDQFADDENVGQIYCEDNLGNTWNLIEENGFYSWEPADVIDAQFPLVELPESQP